MTTIRILSKTAADTRMVKVSKAAISLWTALHVGARLRIVERQRDGLYRVNAMVTADILRGSGPGDMVRGIIQPKGYSRRTVQELIDAGVCMAFQHDEEMRPLVVLAKRFG